jgi:uncharacterized protein (TIGR02996 family)
MATSDCLDAFYLALEETPGDRVTLLALADWYDEQGSAEAAACLRWVVAKGRCPFRYRRGRLSIQSTTLHDGWYWWATDDPPAGPDWGHSQECRLPSALWEQLRHTFDYRPNNCKEYASVRSAYEALLEAWPLAPQLERPPARKERRR